MINSFAYRNYQRPFNKLQLWPKMASWTEWIKLNAIIDWNRWKLETASEPHRDRVQTAFLLLLARNYIYEKRKKKKEKAQKATTSGNGGRRRHFDNVIRKTQHKRTNNEHKRRGRLPNKNNQSGSATPPMTFCWTPLTREWENSLIVIGLCRPCATRDFVCINWRQFCVTCPVVLLTISPAEFIEPHLHTLA